MALIDNSQYQALARRAALGLGTTSPSIQNAILSLWQCELGANSPYPPARNNPGNLSAGFAKDTGIPYEVAPGANPQPGNPIVTFATPEAGADAFARGLATFSRYAPARLAIKAGDGRAFLAAIAAGLYGTNLSCMLSVYPGNAPAGAGVSAGQAASFDSAASMTTTGATNLAALLGLPPETMLSSANCSDILGRVRSLVAAGGVWDEPTSASYLPNGGGSYRTKGQALLDLIGGYCVDMSHGVPPRRLDSIPVDLSTGRSPDPIAAFLGAIPALGASAALLVVIVFLALEGTSRLLDT